ncbi:MAG: acyltransferase [Tatlockia sp.]|nr:acyltransferase [Tatlockia sp.]
MIDKNKQSGGQLYGLLAVLLSTLATVLCFIPILFIGFLKLFPNQRWQSFCTKKVDAIATFWSSINNTYIGTIQKTKWEISGLDNLDPKTWYLVVANHQSWLDIIVLQRVFNHKIPTLKFFIKDQLKWVPFLGFAWWAMGCPFMKRYSKEYLAKNPHKKGKDLQSTHKAVQLFQHNPTSIMSFVEGTRYNPHKSQKQQSPYKHLLKPKAGGISFVISAMGNQINHLLDITIIYSDKEHSLWDFLCRRMKAIKVHIRSVEIPNQFSDPSLTYDEKVQSEFRTWLNNYWHEKDSLIASLKN